MFSKLNAVKFVASSVVGIGAGKIVGQIIKDNIKPETMVEKVTMTAATFAIGGLVAAAAKKYTSDQIDEVASAVVRTVTVMKEAEKLGRINRGESTFEKEGLNESEFKRDAKGKWARNFDAAPSVKVTESATAE